MASKPINLAHFKVVVPSQLCHERSHRSRLTGQERSTRSRSRTWSTIVFVTISETGRRCGLTGAGDGGPAAQEQLTSPNRPVGPVSASRPESQRTWVPVRTEHTARPGKTNARKATQVRCCCPVSQKTHVCHPATYSYPLGKDYILSQGNKYGCLIVQELNITLIHPTCCETTSAPPASGLGSWNLQFFPQGRAAPAKLWSGSRVNK